MYDLSIIIPHYNSVTNLKELLYSIPIKKNIQIIVVDDKSDKHLSEIDILMKKLTHVKFIRNNTTKKGAGVCRNIGLTRAKGKWVLFADSDDIFMPNFYGKISKYFESDYDVIFFKPTSIEKDTGKLSNRHILYEQLINDYISKGCIRSKTRLKYQFFVPWSKMINRQFLQKEEIKFEEVIASNDVMFSTKVGYKMKKFQVVPDVIYCVTKNSGTLTTNSNSEVFDARVEVFIRYYDFLKNNLNNQEFQSLNINGFTILFQAIRNQQKIKKIINIYFKLKRNDVKFIDNRMKNPFFVLRKIINLYKKTKYNKKYVSLK